MTSRFLINALAPCLILIFLIAGSAWAQTATATLSGTVVDSNGAIVPGASVTLTDTAKGFERRVTTNHDGAFTVPLLPPSNYTLLVAREGFASAQVENVILNTNDQRAIRVELKVSPIKDEVIVTPDASLVSTSAAVGSTIDRNFVGNLPLNGRSFQSLILLTPGVVLTPATGGNVGQFSVNGQRSNANYFTVDGVSSNSGVTFTAGGGFVESVGQQLAGALPGQTALGTTQTLLSVDALEEFKIQTSTYSAEFGRQPGGQIQLTSRAGTNDFHGSLFEYVRNEIFDANDWFTNARPLTAQQIEQGLTKQPRAALRQNQFGGTIGGPVIFPRFGEVDKSDKWYWSGRDRTFFFFSYEGLRLLQPAPEQTIVPSTRLRGIAAPSVQPILNAFPIPTGPETLTTSGQLSGFSPYISSVSSPKKIDSTSIRIDHTFNSRVSIFGRYSTTPSESFTRSLSRLNGEKDSKRDITLASTQLLGSNVTNEIRFNYTKSRGKFKSEMDDFGGAVPIDASVLLSGYAGSGVKLGTASISIPPAFLGLQLGDQADMRQEQINLINNLSWTVGKHRFKFGVDYRRLSPTYGPTEYLQQSTFRSLDNLLTGNAFAVVIRARQGARPRFNNYSAYVDDTWNATKRLTLNLGLRWEVNPPPQDVTGLKPTLVCGVENLAIATLCPPDTPLRKTDYTAFAPRVGAAYLLNESAGRETVLRGGFGVFYDLGNTTDLVGFDRYPFSATKIIPNAAFPLTPEQAQPPTFPAVQLPLFQPVTAVNSDLKLPFTLQWNVSIEQSLGTKQVLSVSYVGAAGRHLLSTKSVNNPPLDLPRPNMNFGAIAYTSNDPTSDYHSMQVRFQRRLSRGLQALANYTWSHAIDEISNEFDGTLDRGNADFDVRHNFSGALTYDVPNFNIGPFFNALLRNWSIDSSIYIQSGSPINVVYGSGSTLSDGTLIFPRPDVVPGAQFWMYDPTVPGGRKLNYDAFASPPVNDTCAPFGCFTPARQGTLGRNIVFGPGMHQINIAIRRQFSFGERWKLQLKGEAFNVFNRPHFSSYNATWGFSTPDSFGRAESTLHRTLGGLNALYQVGGPRSLQFSARLTF